MVEQIKGVLLMVFSALSGFFMPIQDLMLAILILLGEIIRDGGLKTRSTLMPMTYAR